MQFCSSLDNAESRMCDFYSLCNILFNSYIYRHSPLAVTHFVTEECNARCAHCFIDFNNPERLKDTLKLDEIITLTKNLGNSLVNVFLSGGEPFLRDDLFQIAEAYFLNARAWSVFITTNGFFTKRIEEFAASFSKSKIDRKLFITISIDDFEEEHDSNRRIKGLFQKAIDSYKTLEGFREFNIFPNIAITVTPNNCDHVEDLYHHLREVYNINTFTVIAMRDEGIASTVDFNTRERILEGYKQLTLAITNDMKCKKNIGYHDSFLGHVINAKNMIYYPILKKIYVRPHYISPCPAGTLYGTIRANGDVYPCEILSQKLGNLRNYNMNFMSLWHQSIAKKIRRNIYKTKCHCSFECAWSFNIISNYRYVPRILQETIKSILRN